MMFNILARSMLKISVALCMVAPLASLAQQYPDHAIELIVPYAPGGSTDAMARLVAPRLSELLKVPVVVSNRAGAGGAIGTAYGLQTHDGYRIVAAGNTNLGPMLIVGQKPTYTIDDVSAIARAIVNPLMVVTKKGRFADFDAFLKEAKQKPDTVTYGSWGPKTPSHFYAEMIAQSAGVKLRHIPYDSGSKEMLAALGGQVDVAVVTAATAKTNIKAGTLTGLLVSTDTKLSDVPSVESIKALGYPGAVYVSFEGFVTSSKVPADRLIVLQQAFEKILNDPQVKAALLETGAEPGYQSGPEYDAFLRKNLTILKDITTKVNMDD
jgi:tripartite-type tricarboxylate transporter receptor subunit TctC